ncbi:MAG: hypothetical protein DHS20C18_15600 [Saprospiraceae bacterium]|nr:MAG: hypothetical protein DHS20C18_15600 [Saprospiraceae bacterium]
MNKFLLSLLAFNFLCVFLSCEDKRNEKSSDRLTDMHAPNDHFFLQRAYPDGTINLKAYTQALENAKLESLLKDEFPGFDLEWIGRGPANIGARVNTIAVHPTNPNIIYTGFSTGGVFKTIDGGSNWTPIFDNNLFLAIGVITLDPNDPETVYVGTGDPNIGGYVQIGDGVYKSTDGGQTWTHLGLTDQRIVSKIVVDPTDSNIIYVSCMGLPFKRNDDRGLYKSTDGGQTWTHILYLSEEAGITDLLINPENPSVLYAAGWNRIRNNMESVTNGPDAKIHKSIDGGATWTLLEGGLPQESIGRIGLAMSGSNPDVLFASYTGNDQELHNIYKSIDAGLNWTPLIDWDTTNLPDNILGGFGWYFGQLRVNPESDDDLFVLGVDLWRTIDGGQTWNLATPSWWSYEVHADKHDLVFAHNNIYLGTDGGLYKSENLGITWTDIENIPTTQFYRVAYNPHLPDWYFGGAQDNGSSGGTSEQDDWLRIYGGDGFQLLFHPTNADVTYAETQNGNFVVSTDGSWQNWSSANTGMDSDDRTNWDTPLVMSPHNPDVMYTGTYRLYRSTAGVFPLWEPVSDDLTDGPGDAARYHTITTLHESPLVPGLVYVGTSDGNVWRVDNVDDFNWTNVTAGITDRYVTDIKASPYHEDWVYVTVSGYKDNDSSPHIFRSTDRGVNWESIDGDLPDLALNDVYILPNNQDTALFVASDGGVYGSMTAGQTWQRLGNNLPFVPVYDLEYNPVRNELVAGTHARSIQSYNLDSIIVVPDTTILNTQYPSIAHQELTVFPSPATGFVNIQLPEKSVRGTYELALLNTSGQLLNNWQGRIGETTEKRVDISTLAKGIYYFKLKVDRKIYRGQFMKS